MADMTNGTPWKLLLRFTIPLLLGNVFQQLYSLIDTIIVGRALGMNALGAIGAVGSLTFFVQGFVMGIASGLSLIMAQRFGTRQADRIRSSFVTSIWIALISVIFLTIVSVLLADWLLEKMNIPSELFADSKAYFVTAMIGLAGLMLFSLLSNIVRSMGDTQRLLRFMVYSQLLNIIFDFLFVLVIPLGVRGVALATILSQLWVGWMCQNYLFRKVPLLHLEKKDWIWDKREVQLHINISLPIGLQSSIISIGSIILQYKLNGLGAAAVEGHAIGAKLENMATMPLVSFGVATATFAAQNYGAGQMERIWKGVRASTFISLAYSLVVGFLLFFYGREIAVWLFGADRADSLLYIERYLQFTTLLYAVLAVLYVFRYALQGMGKSVAPTIAGCVEMGMRSLLPVTLTNMIGFPAIVVSHPMAWAGAAAVVTYALILVKKENQDNRYKRFLTS